MKENRYDTPDFFQKYQSFPRSVEGLKAAGEWEEFQKLLPDFAGKRVLDIGCGFGWHCNYAAHHGAKFVLGTDISEKMLEVAKEKTIYDNVTYQKIAMEELGFPSNSFDVVISSLAFHYTPDFFPICERIAGWLPIGGSFVFSVEHPIYTAQGSQQWIYNDQGEALYWPVDRYFEQGRREAVFLGEKVIKYHKTLTTYVNGLLQTGFAITHLVEPTPPKQWLEENAQMREELRRPMMLLIAARKES
ncbi:MAG: class I SAM-dependent methyltransferase [Clostridiales bacterium]|nr:class I SAM-dependent methyltransferase [Clostridiales bacterium]